MKPSHLTTPRSMEECVFMLDADPIEIHAKQKFDWQDKVVMWGAALSAIALVLILFAE